MKKRAVYNVSYKERKAIARGINEENKQYGQEFINMNRVPAGFTIIDRNGTPQIFQKAFRNHKFVAQIYDQGNWIRISVNRTKYDADNDLWMEGISWDELMEVKRAIGFGNSDAIEIYPKDGDIVDVTNMRHLFIAKDGSAPDCIWRKINPDGGIHEP